MKVPHALRLTLHAGVGVTVPHLHWEMLPPAVQLQRVL